MRKTLVSTLVCVLFAGALFAGGVSFNGFFPGIPGYRGALLEKPDSFNDSGILLSQTRYTHEKGDRWAIVSYTVGRTVDQNPAMPYGYSMNQNGIVIRVKRMQGLVSFYTYYTMQKKGNVIVYAPSNKKQKYPGLITFSFTNMAKAEADAFMKKFNFSNICSQMEKVK